MMVAEEGEKEEEVVVVGVVDSIDGPHEAWRCAIYWFLVKFTDEKNWLRTDVWTDVRTDLRTDVRTDVRTDGHTFL